MQRGKKKEGVKTTNTLSEMVHPKPLFSFPSFFTVSVTISYLSHPITLFLIPSLFPPSPPPHGFSSPLHHHHLATPSLQRTTTTPWISLLGSSLFAGSLPLPLSIALSLQVFLSIPRFISGVGGPLFCSLLGWLGSFCSFPNQPTTLLVSVIYN